MNPLNLNMPHDVLLNSPKQSPQFPCQQVERILVFILHVHKMMCMNIWFILITKQHILCG